MDELARLWKSLVVVLGKGVQQSVYVGVYFVGRPAGTFR